MPFPRRSINPLLAAGLLLLTVTICPASTHPVRAQHAMVIGVPGSVAGMTYAEQKYGKLTLKQVMAPAIKLAREGFPLTWEEADWMHDQYLANFPESHRVFQRNGNYYKAGEIFQQPDLART